MGHSGREVVKRLLKSVWREQVFVLVSVAILIKCQTIAYCAEYFQDSIKDDQSVDLHHDESYEDFSLHHHVHEHNFANEQLAC